MSLIISDSSVLIHLSAVERLFLLHQLYRIVIVPPSVISEISERGWDKPGVEVVQSAIAEGWIQTITPRDEALVQSLRQRVDWGEAEAIALAIENKADLLLLDDANARLIADMHGVAKIGTLGILVQAKKAGLILSVKDELERLRSRMWLIERLIQSVLRSVGEA